MAGLEMPKAGWDEDDVSLVPTPGGVLDGLPDEDSGSSLHLLLSPEDIASIDGAGDRQSAGGDEPGPLQEARAVQTTGQKSSPKVEREYNPRDQNRPELERMTRDPAIAKAMDDYFSRSQYTNPKDYKGEPGFYVMQDSSGRVWADPYDIVKAKTEQGGISTETAPYGWRSVRDFMLNQKPMAIYHPHPNGGPGWVQGPDDDDVKASGKTGLPGIIKAPDGLHYFGVRTPEKPAPYHGLFNW